MKHTPLLLYLLLSCMPSMAQESSFTQQVEIQGSFSHGQTPLWLNANKYGLSSLSDVNGYLGYLTNYTRKQGNWQINAGADIYLPIGYRMQGYQEHYTSHIVLQQAFADICYRNIYLSIGAKERPLTLRNNRLSSGSQTLGINARPIPQVRIGMNDYWDIPGLNRWASIKAHLAFGVMTDGEWESAFTANTPYKYNRLTRHHEKAGYLRIGKERYPLTFTLGLEMASQFGGMLYKWKGTDQSDFNAPKIVLDSNLKSYKNALLGTKSSDLGETQYQNNEGNLLGSWVARFDWNSSKWNAGIYLDHFFEDHSGLLLIDYDGYGFDDEWNERKENRWFTYKPADFQMGIDLHLKHTKWVKNVTLEFMNATYQSGPIYHDHNQTWSDHICGVDDFYNHSRLPGWQHWGQVIGNPLYRSPQYNSDGYIGSSANRVKAWHGGVSGNIHPLVTYRCLLSYQKSWGTYSVPFLHPHENTSILLEASTLLFPGLLFSNYNLPDWLDRPMYLTLAYGQDFGKLLGNSQGLQITLKCTIE